MPIPLLLGDVVKLLCSGLERSGSLTSKWNQVCSLLSRAQRPAAGLGVHA